MTFTAAKLSLVHALVVLFTLSSIVHSASAQDRSLRDNPELAAYFEHEVSRIEQKNELTHYQTPDDWETAEPQLREQLFDMLGLSPRPEKTELQAAITGTVESDEFTVESVQFQSLPGLYVTGNFYRPKELDGKLPTILYVCGHGQVKKDGISFGNKTHYQHHGSWYARNGYCCLTIDTLQLGEIEGIHHGTYRENRWWWNSRGYTPAGVEAWNCIRALDYLETRPEVDLTRLGVTGRSGGGAYSWWISALDKRIACSVPVAGITNLRDHVINGCVEGHCDCMFMVNTQRWDYATIAALVAPRPLLISNTDKDTIFPLEGVIDIHRQVRHIYQLHNAGDKLGLQITEGPHEDTQELHIHSFRWFNRFLKNDKSMIDKTATRFFQPEQLKVFSVNPTDEINTRIDESFVQQTAVATPEDILTNQDAWFSGRLAQIRERSFKAWPDNDPDWTAPQNVQVKSVDITDDDVTGVPGKDLQRFQIRFESQPHVSLNMHAVLSRNESLETAEAVRVFIASNPTRAIPENVAAKANPVVVFSPRGIGEHAWAGNLSKQTQIRRRFQLIGTTAESMRIWDIRRAIQTVRQVFPNAKYVTLMSEQGELDQLTLIASLYEPTPRLAIKTFSSNPTEWPSILNLTRTISPQELLAMATYRDVVLAVPLNKAETLNNGALNNGALNNGALNNGALNNGAPNKKPDDLLSLSLLLRQDPRWKGHEVQTLNFDGIPENK